MSHLLPVLKNCDGRDDCGAYSRFNTRPSVYIRGENDTLQLVKFNKDYNLWCKAWKNAPLPEQPKEEDFIEITKHYAKQYDDNGQLVFERFIIRLTKASGRGEDKVGYCVVAYEGESRGSRAPHRNARKSRQPYRRTAPHVLQKQRELLSQGKFPREVQCDMVRRLPSPEHPRNLRQVRNQQMLLSQDMSTPCKNISDEILKVMTDFYTSDFIQDIIFVRKDCPPAIVLYKEQQVFDLIQFCSVEEAWELVTPAGIDKTYNISSAFLTAIVFPNRKLERDDQNVNSWPTWLGPLCLHWTSDKATFVKFFEKVKCDMGDYVPQGFTINAEKLMIGSDEEQAIVSALSHVFPGSIQLLCTHHISENLERHISHMDMSQREKGALHRKIMKLRHCKDLVEFKSEGQKIVEEVTNEHEREDAEYIEKVLEKMLKFSVEPRMQEGDIVPQDFTTNRSESFNSYVKLILHHNLGGCP